MFGLRVTRPELLEGQGLVGFNRLSPLSVCELAPTFGPRVTRPELVEGQGLMGFDRLSPRSVRELGARVQFCALRALSVSKGHA